MSNWKTELICAAVTCLLYALTPINTTSEAAGYLVMYYVIARLTAWMLREEKEETKC